MKQLTRLDFLAKLGGGFGLTALAGLEAGPLTARPPHFAAKAKSVVFLFMHGGASQMESFDPKPLLTKLHGQKLPPSLANVQLQFTKASDSPIMAPTVKFARHGQSGIEVSENWPHVARCVDDLAIVRSCHHDGFTHSLAMNLMLTGSNRLGFPSVGSWVTYGLGSESENLPGFIVMLQGGIKAGPPAWGSGFLPASYQGTVMRSRGAPFLNVVPPSGMTLERQKSLLEDVAALNKHHRARRQEDTNLAARIASYELAFRMQTEAPELADLSQEDEKTKQLYGLDGEETRDFGMKCLLARRLVERGVRFVQLYSGTSDGDDDWDSHANNDVRQRKMSRRVDRPIAALLEDLKRRGLLDRTLVVWGGDFGRTPITDAGMMSGGGFRGGRDHNPYGFTMWFAGGGVRGGQVIGETDELGFRAIKDPLHTHDIHATMLALLGLDHKKLTYFFQGRDFRLTDVHGEHEFSRRLLG
jgi:hypothetical protein